MSWERECYDTFSYHSYDIDQVIQGAGRTLTAIGVGDIHLAVQALGGRYHDIVLIGVLHCPILFTNLISASGLGKKDWYLYSTTFNSRLLYPYSKRLMRTADLIYTHHLWLLLLLCRTFLPPIGGLHVNR